jgi:hypothetical protein
MAHLSDSLCIKALNQSYRQHRMCHKCSTSLSKLNIYKVVENTGCVYVQSPGRKYKQVKTVAVRWWDTEHVSCLMLLSSLSPYHAGVWTLGYQIFPFFKKSFESWIYR